MVRWSRACSRARVVAAGRIDHQLHLQSVTRPLSLTDLPCNACKANAAAGWQQWIIFLSLPSPPPPPCRIPLLCARRDPPGTGSRLQVLPPRLQRQWQRRVSVTLFLNRAPHAASLSCVGDTEHLNSDNAVGCIPKSSPSHAPPHPSCTQSESLCMVGTEPVNGQCCVETVNTMCFASLEACPEGAATLGTICEPEKVYYTVVQHVQVEPCPDPSGKVRWALARLPHSVSQSSLLSILPATSAHPHVRTLHARRSLPASPSSS